MVPTTLKEIIEENKEESNKFVYTNGTNYALRQHGNLTTIDGLLEFANIVPGREKVGARLVFRYQILDDAYKFLTENGFEIVEKVPCKEQKNCDCLNENKRADRKKRKNTSRYVSASGERVDSNGIFIE